MITILFVSIFVLCIFCMVLFLIAFERRNDQTYNIVNLILEQIHNAACKDLELYHELYFDKFEISKYELWSYRYDLYDKVSYNQVYKHDLNVLRFWRNFNINYESVLDLYDPRMLSVNLYLQDKIDKLEKPA